MSDQNSQGRSNNSKKNPKKNPYTPRDVQSDVAKDRRNINYGSDTKFEQSKKKKK